MPTTSNMESDVNEENHVAYSEGDHDVESGEGNHAEYSGSRRESKLELFGFDTLVNKLGLKRLAIHRFLCFCSCIALSFQFLRTTIFAFEFVV